MRRSIALLLFCLGALNLAQAQLQLNPTFGNGQNIGSSLYAFGSFDNKGFDSINLGNLNSHFSIPITSKPGRGMNFSYVLNYDSLIWSPVTSGGSTYWQPSGIGFTGSYGETATGTLTAFLQVQDPASECNSEFPIGTAWKTLTNFTYTDSYGIVHPFDFNYILPCQGVGPLKGAAYSTGTGKATDGSGLTLTNILTIITKSGATIIPEWIFPTTSAFWAPPAVPTSNLIDTNGNKITVSSSGTFTDTLGTTALTMSGSGSASSPLVFTYPVTLQPDAATSATATIYFKTYTVATNFQCSGIQDMGDTTVDLVDHIDISSTAPTGAHSVLGLPTPSVVSYRFQYENTPGLPATDYGSPVTGRLTSIILPSGGAILYSYSGGSGGCSGINPDGTAATLTRTTNDGNKVYARTISGSTSSTSVIDESSNQSTYSFVNDTSSHWYETERKIWQGAASGTPLEDRVTQYNGQTTPSQLTSSITQTTVLDSYNGGSQSNATTVYDGTTGVVTSTSLAIGGVTQLSSSYIYNSNHQVSQASTSDGSGVISETTYGYDESALVGAFPGYPQAGAATRGNLTSSHVQLLDPGSTHIDTTYVYYDTGSVSTVTTPNGTTIYTYDPSNSYVTGTTMPTPSSGVALTTSAQYDTTSGAQLSSTGLNTGQTAQVQQYDRQLRPIAVSAPDGGQVTSIYEPAYTEVMTKIDSSRYSDQAVFYDGYGRPVRSGTYNGSVWYLTDTCYGANGRVQATSIAYSATTTTGFPSCSSGAATIYSYDALGRITNVAHPDGTWSSATYNSRAVKRSNSQGVSKIIQYDALGRPSVICELSNSTSMPGSGSPVDCGDYTPGGLDIDGVGFLSGVGYYGGNLSFGQGSQFRGIYYDRAGRTVQTVAPESGQTNYGYAYNSTGLVVTRQRPKANQSSSSVLTTTTTQYDKLGRVVSISYDDGLTPTKNFQYDMATDWHGGSMGSSIGQLTYAATGSTSDGMEFSYDPMGRVSQTIQCLQGRCGNGAFDVTRSYGYDYAGDLTRESYLMAANSGSEVDTNYAYTIAGETSGITNNLTSSPGTSGGTILANIQNGPAGPTSFQLGNGLNGVLGYDSLNRASAKWLCSSSTAPGCAGGTQVYNTSATIKGAQVTALSDSILNTTLSLGYDEFNRLTSANASNGAGSFNWTYDRWGNRWAQSLTAGSGPVQSLLFNTATNQVSGFTYDAAGNVLNDGFHQYTYDAEGNVLTVDAGATASYTYDALNHRTQTVASGFTTQFAFGLSGQRVSSWDGAACVPTLLEANTYWNGAPIALFDGTQTYYQHQDLVGTERLRTTPDGLVTGAYTSLPFGDGLSVSGSDTDQNHFAGLDHDAESDTEHAQFRQYSSTSGRWMSPDPYLGSISLTNPQSYNRYTYALNNPLMYVDPSGLVCTGGPYDYDPLTGYYGDQSLYTTQGGCFAGEGSWATDNCDDPTNGCTVNVSANPDPPPADTQNWNLDPGQLQLGGGFGLYSGGSSGDIPGGGGGAGVGGLGGAPSKGTRSGYESLFCLGDALKANGVSLALDVASVAVGEIPGAASAVGAIKLYATIGVGSIGAAYSAATSPNFGVGAAQFTLGTVGTAASSLAVLQELDTSATPLKAIPFLGNALSLFTTGIDVAKTYQAQSNCVDSGKYD